MSRPLLPHRAMHLVSARGGGSARFARDLAAHADGHALLHVGDDTWVVEMPGAAATFHPYRLPEADAGDWLQALLDAHGADLLHVHFLHATTLPVLASWCRLDRPFVISVHDIGFLRADVFDCAESLPTADAAWLRRWRPLLASAALITVPSRFLAELFGAAYPGLATRTVAPGVDRRRHAVATAPTRTTSGGVRTAIAPASSAGGDPSRMPAAAALAPEWIAKTSVPGPITIGIVGALGPHKGKQRLLNWLRHTDAARFRWVLIGYTDDQLQPGWLAERLWVHGPFHHHDTARWLRHYAVDLVLFPNRMAESFSYALSDVWAAGVPVMVPALGALGERVQLHGGGALLPNPDDADAVLGLLSVATAVSPDGSLDTVTASGGVAIPGAATGLGGLPLWRRQLSKRHSMMIPTIDQMVTQMAACYRQLPTARTAAIASSLDLQSYLRSQLDEVVFRHENIRLARDYAQVRAWGEKLGQDVLRLDQDLAGLGATRAELERQLARREADIEGLRTGNQVLEQTTADLKSRNQWLEQTTVELKSRNQQIESDAVALSHRVHTQNVETAELRARVGHLNGHLAEVGAQRQQLAELSTAQALEITVMHQRINALVVELRPLRVKGARYDRVRAWLPDWLLPWLRRGRDWLAPRATAGGSR